MALSRDQAQALANTITRDLGDWKAWAQNKAATTLGTVASVDQILSELNIDKNAPNLGAGAPILKALPELMSGDAKRAAVAATAATAAGICLATGPGAPACMVASGVAILASVLVDAVADLLTQRTLPPSLISTPAITADNVPPSMSEMIAVVNATERLRRSEANVIGRLASAYVASYQAAMGEAPPDDAQVVLEIAQALRIGGYQWDPIQSLPSWKEDADSKWADHQRELGMSEEWIAQANQQLAGECNDPSNVLYCSPGNDLWRQIQNDYRLQGRADFNRVVQEIKDRAAQLPKAIASAASALARIVAEDVAAAFPSKHGGMSFPEWNQAMQRASDAAGAAAGAAGAAAAGLYLDAFAEAHGGLYPSEWIDAVDAGDVDPADFPGTTRDDGRSAVMAAQATGSTDAGAPVELGGGLDTTGASSGGSIAGPAILVLGGMAALFVFLLNKKRR